MMFHTYNHERGEPRVGNFSATGHQRIVSGFCLCIDRGRIQPGLFGASLFQLRPRRFSCGRRVCVLCGAEGAWSEHLDRQRDVARRRRDRRCRHGTPCVQADTRADQRNALPSHRIHGHEHRYRKPLRHLRRRPLPGASSGHPDESRESLRPCYNERVRPPFPCRVRRFPRSAANLPSPHKMGTGHPRGRL